MAAHQALPSLGFSRQEHWSGLPFPSPTHESEKKVKSLSLVQLFATPWTAARQVSLSFTISQSLPKFMFITSMMPSSHLILWHSLLLLPLIFPSIRDFSNESSVHIRWPKYLSFSLSLPVNIQSWSPLRFTDLISLLSKGLSGVFSSTTVWRHQFFGVLPSLQSNFYNHTWPWGRLWRTFFQIL